MALLDVGGVADYLGTSTRHVRHLVYTERIPVTRVGGLLRFRTDEIEKWLNSNTTSPRTTATSRRTELDAP